jgi:hypothetical protein
MEEDEKYNDWSQVLCDLWNNPKTSAEEKIWIDAISTRKTFKFSQQEKIMAMYRENIGPFPGWY